MTLETDYLVVGAGAMGMAFADVLMTETDATVLLVDRGGRPGGHWNVAYPFVRLHQPSAFYGVNSRKLGSDTKDETGWNAGLYELASGAEVVAYFDQVMHQQFLPSGRVQYFPMCQYEGDGTFRSLLSGETHEVIVKRKLVDTTYMNVIVPSMRPPAYDVADGVRCVPPNALPTIDEPPTAYAIVGAGKTAIDAALWLLANGVDPDDITWIRPRDSWLLDRAIIQPGREFFDAAVGGFAHRTEAAALATSVEDLFERLEATGQLLRLDPDVAPTMYRCATVTIDEVAQLRRITDVVRQGRVQAITEDEIVLDRGSVPHRAGTLFVDCSADGLERRPVVPMFHGDTITVQTVRTCQQVFSSAFVAHVEAAYDDEARQNELCTVVPHPDSDIDWLRTTLGDTLNAVRWQDDPDLQDWLMRARLDGFSGSRGDPDAEQMEVLVRILEHAPDAMTNLERLLREIDG
jgi:hypothetical protein